MGHVGLTPQTATALGGYRSQGRTAERALEVMHDALALQEAGCFSIVFEAVPAALTELVMPRMQIPVIGIGAGAATDGQVLVFHDLLGIYDGHAARFVKRYAEVREEMIKGVTAYVEDVRTRRYPEPEHGYTMAPDEIDRLHELMRERRGEPFTGGFSLVSYRTLRVVRGLGRTAHPCMKERFRYGSHPSFPAVPRHGRGRRRARDVAGRLRLRARHHRQEHQERLA